MGRPKGAMGKSVLEDLARRLKDGEFNGLCYCGCGQKTQIATRTTIDREGRRISFMGYPMRYVEGHEPQRQHGADNPQYMGRRINPYGYVLIHQPDHPRADKDGYVKEHIVIMEGLIGRPLKKADLHGPNRSDDEVVHHKDEDKQNNAPGNLELMTHSAHIALHRKLKKAAQSIAAGS